MQQLVENQLRNSSVTLHHVLTLLVTAVCAAQVAERAGERLLERAGGWSEGQGRGEQERGCHSW